MVQKSKVYGYARFATQAQLSDQKVVTKLDMPAPAPQKLLRVCAYARVSSPKETMLHSLSAQVSYYNSYIQKHPGWLFCGVYADEGISGTKENRDEFQRMMEDCRNGKIDLIGQRERRSPADGGLRSLGDDGAGGIAKTVG